MDIQRLSDDVLLTETKKLVGQEREGLIKILHHLREIDRRRLFSSQGFSSLFAYAVKQLGYSEDQAHRRISAMRLLKDLPQVEEKIQSGTISLTNLSMAHSLFKREAKLSPMNTEQKINLLEKLENKPSREAEKILIQHSSQPLTLSAEKIRIVAENLVEMKILINDSLQEKIKTLKGLLAHSNPNMSVSELIEKLCDLGLHNWDPARKEKERGNASQTESPELKSTEMNQSKSLTSPWAPQKERAKNVRPLKAGVRRQVWKRAQSKCENCGSNYALQIDHKVPRAVGGSNELENLRLLCQSCNQRAAIEYFGVEKMEKHFRGKKTQKGIA